MTFHLHSDFSPSGDQPQAIEALVNGFESGNQFETLKGVTGSGKTFIMANIIERLKKPTLIISHNKTLAAQLYGEMKEFFPDNAVEYFVSYYDYYQPEAYIPHTDTFIEKDASTNDEIDRLRHGATEALLTRRDVIVVASVSCIYGIGSPKNYLEMSFEISKNGNLSQSDFIRKLVSIQYHRNDLAFERGNFRVMGDTVDLYPANGEYAYRFEFGFDTLEEIKIVDPLTFEAREKPEHKAPEIPGGTEALATDEI